MIKSIAKDVFAFDIEWIPDPYSAHLLHQTPVETVPQCEDAMHKLWKEGKATPENPQPYLKTILCRIVSIVGILRSIGDDGCVNLRLVSLPKDPHDPSQASEISILSRFLRATGRRRPQLVGYNSENADIPIIVQRAIVNGLPGHGFSKRPNKPWEGFDYFSAHSDGHIDMAPLLGRWNQTPSLHEAAVLSGIPGKLDVSGSSVPELWLQNRLSKIVAYNEFDAFTTFLLWARIAHFSDLLDKNTYEKEQELVEALLLSEIAGSRPHLQAFLDEWQRLREIARQRNAT